MSSSIVVELLQLVRYLTKWTAKRSQNGIGVFGKFRAACTRLHHLVKPFNRNNLALHFAVISGENFWNSAEISHDFM
uniref:Uncharacterized protein n=1 Tax=Physcomitrium patens TaxID=3218 RepID=A0A2K1L265_PHYPA|nr:hypothetical protein PHYPA_002915 [Physcomitrium patens]